MPFQLGVALSHGEGIEQLVAGDGSTGSDLDVTKIPQAFWTLAAANPTEQIQLKGELITNTCANITNCMDCAAQAACGWCRTSGKCLLGTASGPFPSEGICPSWRFTFNTAVSRRLVQNFDAHSPINPKNTVVFLTSAPTGTDVEIDALIRTGDTRLYQCAYSCGFMNLRVLAGVADR
jgi:hypothetical protein